MKSEISSKDNNYSLNSSENYKKDIELDLNIAIKKYSELIIEYLKFIIENIKIKNSILLKFIIIRGLDTITNVFLNILYFTKNSDLTYFHSQKSYYFYVEFVSQISDDEKMFLQLTSRDAVTYVYKKTVFDINNEFKKINEIVSEDFLSKMNLIKEYINLYQTYVLKIIHNKNLDLKYISNLVKITDKLNNTTKKNKINILNIISDKIYQKVDNLDLFFELNELLIKNVIKNSKTFVLNENKFNSDEFNEKIVEMLPIKFINWLFI